MLHHFTRRAVLASALALLLLPMAQLHAATPDTRCFELRIYTAAPGKLEALHARFRDHTIKLFEKHGITNIGYWVPSENPETKLYYVLAYPSKEARETAWKEFAADPDWVKAKAESEVGGKLVAAVEQRFWQPTDFSPEVKAAVEPGHRIFELRTYAATAGNLDKLVGLSRKYSAELFKSYGINFLAAWTPLAGEKGTDTLTYLLSYPSVEAREAASKKAAEDPKMAAIADEAEKLGGGGSLLKENGMVSVSLIPTDYSPTK